ncbi:alkaline phosphatase family protein [Pseudomaricurvus alkylphenolicus]|uniref:alkaline phosphatase family protein n=1 Tax=Pseudomaricurvus alkylphenolicus TaxID=1306991 RepID=UPI0030B8AC96
MSASQVNELPLIIAGPILRRCDKERFTLWLATTQAVNCRLQLQAGQTPIFEQSLTCPDQQRQIAIGERGYIQLISVSADIPEDQSIHYELWLKTEGDSQERALSSLIPLGLDDGPRPSFFIPSRSRQILHGSCRKPHYAGPDALTRAESLLRETAGDPNQRPSLLLMSGDQIYCDDVAGPMLDAIFQVIKLLGLFPEKLQGAIVDDTEALYQHAYTFYHREQLLPLCSDTPSPFNQLFKGARKPIFTSIAAHNHLVSAAEVFAMYLLVWSPQLWAFISFDNQRVDEDFRQRYQKEQTEIERFRDGLPQVQRALANIPVCMIFDDHDITDDWNLTRGWEEAAYQHPFSRRILGNALLGYWLCQGWGNRPEATPEPWFDLFRPCDQDWTDDAHSQLIDELLHHNQWHYSLPTTPPIVVMDTRTHRWRSESNPDKPSGLMDWESLSDLQQHIIHQESVILVSAAPVFGVKLIEVIQRIFTFFGRPLMVDAENWMAHPGAANVLLNMFMHIKAPQNLIILSGDVHYSFVYDVSIRRKKRLPQSNKSAQILRDREIWQITASGIKNEFPATLIRWFDRFDRFLYSRRSPLNWFTKRRRLSIRSRKPSNYAPLRLVNRSGLGVLKLNDIGEPAQISLLHGDGTETVFPPRGK